tara:strand:- start:401 stop:973 length:573 start_codon:yes stop_codon:yes gene_type:complete
VKPIRVLVGCEYSGEVRRAFTRLGHDAWSCDWDASDDRSLFHIRKDILEVAKWGWDMMIAFPPCTHLARSGARWFKDKKELQEEALWFIQRLMDFDIPKIAIENPVGVISTRIRKPDQIIHPYQFGDEYTKQTCLWLKNLPLLTPSNVVDKGEMVIHGGKKIPKWYSNRTRRRDRTFPGIAKAMADQWGN